MGKYKNPNWEESLVAKEKTLYLVWTVNNQVGGFAAGVSRRTKSEDCTVPEKVESKLENRAKLESRETDGEIKLK